MDKTDSFMNGERFLHRRDYPAALRCFESDLHVLGADLSQDYHIALLLHIGNIYAQLGLLEKAKLHYTWVLRLQKDQNNSSAVGETLVNLGNLAREMGALKRAEAYYLEAQDQLDENKDPISVGILYSNFALLAQDEGAIDEAIVYLEKAITLHKQTGHEAGLASTWGQLARLFVLKGNDREGEICFNYAATHFGSLSDPYGEVAAVRGLCEIYETRGDFELSRTCLMRLLQVARRYGLPQSESDRQRLRICEQALQARGKRSNER